MKKVRKFAEGGWSTSVSFNAEDAKRRADQWAKDHPAKTAAKPAATLAPVSDNKSTATKFTEHWKGMQQVKENTPRPAPSTDKAVRPARTTASNDNDMLPSDAASKLRKEIAKTPLLAAATLAAGPVAGRALSVPKAGGFVGKAGSEALKSLGRRGRMVRVNQAKKYAKPAGEVAREAARKGASYAKGGMVRGDGCASKGKTKGRMR